MLDPQQQPSYPNQSRKSVIENNAFSQPHLLLLAHRTPVVLRPLPVVLHALPHVRQPELPPHPRQELLVHLLRLPQHQRPLQLPHQPLPAHARSDVALFLQADVEDGQAHFFLILEVPVSIVEMRAVEHPKYILVQLGASLDIREAGIPAGQKVSQQGHVQHHVLQQGGRVQFEFQQEEHVLLQADEIRPADGVVQRLNEDVDTGVVRHLQLRRGEQGAQAHCLVSVAGHCLDAGVFIDVVHGVVDCVFRDRQLIGQLHEPLPEGEAHGFGHCRWSMFPLDRVVAILLLQILQMFLFWRLRVLQTELTLFGAVVASRDIGVRSLN